MRVLEAGCEEDGTIFLDIDRVFRCQPAVFRADVLEILAIRILNLQRQAVEELSDDYSLKES